MKAATVSLALLLSSVAVPALADDVENVYRLGTVAKNTGIATDFDVSGWNQYLDIHIGSMLPGDARKVADAVCGASKQNMRFEKPWTARVFLVVGERPAATCRL